MEKHHCTVDSPTIHSFCELEAGREPKNCNHAERLLEKGLSREDCPHWEEDVKAS